MYKFQEPHVARCLGIETTCTRSFYFIASGLSSINSNGYAGLLNSGGSEGPSWKSDFSRKRFSPHYSMTLKIFLRRASSHSRASLVAQMVKSLPSLQETQVQSLGWEDPLEKEMATLSSILAWRTPWKEELGRLQPMGSQRVGHDWAINTLTVMRNPKPASSNCWLLHWVAYSLSECKLLSQVRLFTTPWTVAHQAPLSMGFFRQE